MALGPSLFFCIYGFLETGGKHPHRTEGEDFIPSEQKKRIFGEDIVEEDGSGGRI